MGKILKDIDLERMLDQDDNDDNITITMSKKDAKLFLDKAEQLWQKFGLNPKYMNKKNSGKNKKKRKK